MVVTSSDIGTGSAPNPVVTPLSNSKAVSPSQFKSIFLHEWWLVKPPRQSDGLAVGGIASIQRERVFLSTLIAKRHEANVLETEDGITIIFRGFINTSRTCQNGFPCQLYQHFLFGFPHDWKKYTVHSFGGENIDGVTGFDDSNACSQKANDALVECQAENVKNGQPLIGIYDHDPCTVGRVKSPISTNKTRKVQLSSNIKEKQCKSQKILDVSTCSRMVTRSILRRSHPEPIEDKKVTISKRSHPIPIQDEKVMISKRSHRMPIEDETISKRSHRMLIDDEKVAMSKRSHRMSIEDEKVTISKRSHPMPIEDEKVTVRRSCRLSNCRK